MMALDDMGDKTDGLMAEWSIGNKQSQVNSGLFQFSGNRRGEFVFDLVMAPDAAHKGNVNGRQASQDSLCSETCQGSHGKNDFGVLPWHRTNARVVIDHDITCLGIRTE